MDTSSDYPVSLEDNPAEEDLRAVREGLRLSSVRRAAGSAAGSQPLLPMEIPVPTWEEIHKFTTPSRQHQKALSRLWIKSGFVIASPPRTPTPTGAGEAISGFRREKRDRFAPSVARNDLELVIPKPHKSLNSRSPTR
jgi:hypothetical protein